MFAKDCTVASFESGQFKSPFFISRAGGSPATTFRRKDNTHVRNRLIIVYNYAGRRKVAPEFIRHTRAAGQQEARSREQLKAFIRREFEIFPDAEKTNEDLVSSAGWTNAASPSALLWDRHQPISPFHQKHRLIARHVAKHLHRARRPPNLKLIDLWRCG